MQLKIKTGENSFRNTTRKWIHPEETPVFLLVSAFVKKKDGVIMKEKHVEPFVISMTQRRYAVSREELASVEILKSTGIPLLEAAQAAYVAVRAV